MNIAVLVKQVPDTWDERHLSLETGTIDRAGAELVLEEVNERALEVALLVKDSDKSHTVTLVSMGPASTEKALRRGLAMGADDAVHIIDDGLAEADILRTAKALAGAMRGRDIDLIVGGNESTDGRGGVVPAMVAEILGRPFIGSCDDVTISPQGIVAKRVGLGGIQRVTAQLPAVISVTERTAEARFPSFKGILGAKKKPVTKVALVDIADFDLEGPSTVILSTVSAPPRNVGTTIVDDGDAGSQLAKFLTDNRLV